MTKTVSHLLWGFISLCITLVVLIAAVYVYLEIQLPNVTILKDMHMQVPLRIYTSDHQLIAQYGSMRRTPVALKDVPPKLISAVLATEDARYYDHPGVDFVGIVRAAVAVIASGKKVQGASTITMQVARNFFLSRKKTYGRKIKEILLALKIDKELSKNKVLELYLNKVYFGKQAYGVAAAAEVYYGKPLKQLTLAQMAMIAGLPQAPSRNNPLNNPEQALKRRNHVLWRMQHVGFIKRAEYQQAIKQPLSAHFHGRRILVHAPYFAEMVREVVVHDFGDQAYDSGLSVYTTLSGTLQQKADRVLQHGLIAYSMRHGFMGSTKNLGMPTQDVLPQWQKQLAQMGNPAHLVPAVVINVEDDQQKQIRALVSDGNIITISWSGLAWARPRLKSGYVGDPPQTAGEIVRPGDVIWTHQDKHGRWALTQLPKVQGAIISMNPQDGAILALCGGFDYALSKFNRATQAQRQPGSSFKPFIYSAALSKGYTLATIINDAPIVLNDSGENSLWRPHNDNYKFYGPTRLKVGLAKSRNLVSIRILQGVGIDYTLNHIKKFGFDPNQLPNTLSLALGSGDVTPMQMASGYAVFANGGYQVMPYFIDHINDQRGKTIYQANIKTACMNCFNQTEAETKNYAPRVLPADNAYLMNNALQSVITTGTGRAALALNRQDLAGKTGTTNKQIDGWFSGYNSHILTSVWVGFDDLTPLKEYGSQVALPIWIRLMKTALAGQPEISMAQPPDIITARIDAKNGLLAPPGDPNTIYEQFRSQYAPTHYAAATSSQPPSNTTQQPITAQAPANPDNDNGPLF